MSGPGVTWRRLPYLLLLPALALAAYANSFQVPFVLDDERTALNSTDIRPPLTLAKLLSTDRPMQTASLALNYRLGGLSVSGYHALNLAAHVVCGLLVFGLTRYTLRLPVLRERFGARADALALVVAAVFLVHPMQVGSVTYVAQRVEIFAAIALVGSLWIAAAAARAFRPWRHLPPLAAIGVFGLLSKESVAVLPLLFALYDWCFLAAGQVREMVRRWPVYLVLSAVGAGAGAWGWWFSGWYEGHPVAGFRTELIRPWQYCQWQFGVVLYYVRLFLVPDRLCFDCGYMGPWPVRHSVLGEAVWLPATALVGAVAVAWLARRRFPLATFSVLGSAIVLVPTSSLMPLADVYFEHRMYLPTAFLAILAVTLAACAGEAAVRRGWVGGRVMRGAFVALIVTVLVTFVALTRARNVVFADPVRLWEDSLAKAPENSRVQFNLGNLYLFERGRPDLAVAHFVEAIRHDRDTLGERTDVGVNGVKPYLNLGIAYRRLRRYPEMLEAYRSALQRDPTWGLIHYNLSVGYLSMGNVGEALASAEQAVALDPRDVKGRKMLGSLYVRVGRRADALREYRAAARLAPRDADVQRNIELLSRPPA